MAKSKVVGQTMGKEGQREVSSYFYLTLLAASAYSATVKTLHISVEHAKEFCMDCVKPSWQSKMNLSVKN